MVYYSKLKIVFLCINVNEQQQQEEQKECNMLKKHTKLNFPSIMSLQKCPLRQSNKEIWFRFLYCTRLSPYWG